MSQKLQYQQLKEHAHVEHQNFSNILTENDQYVSLSALSMFETWLITYVI